MINMKQKKTVYRIMIVFAVALAFLLPPSTAVTTKASIVPVNQPVLNALHNIMTEPTINEKATPTNQNVIPPAETPRQQTHAMAHSLRGRTALYVDDNAVYPGDGTLATPYRYIWQGVQNATDDDTIYVFNGTYYENVVVDKSVDIIGESKEATIVNGSDTGRAFYVTANNVFIGHFKIENNDAIGILLASKYNQILDCFCVRMGWIYGIWITDSNNQITNCTCLNSYIGIYVGSDYNQITNCNCSYNRVAGIQIDTGCKYNHIINCTCSNNKVNGLYLYQHANYNQVEGCTLSRNQGMGLLIERSTYNLFRNNTLVDNIYNLGVSSYNLIPEYTQDIDTSNTINGKPIYYLVGEQGRTLDGSIQTIGYVALVSCRNITVRNINSERNLIGILVVNTSGSIVMNSSFRDNQQNGMILLYSSENLILNCTCAGNPAQGLLASLSSTNNTVKECNCSNNKNDGISMSGGGNQIIRTTCHDNEFSGIDITGSPLMIQGCNSSGNHQYGISIVNAPASQITDCIFRDNRGNGISLQTSPGSVITSCDCSGNLNIGIQISDSSNCHISYCNCSNDQTKGMEISWFSTAQITSCVCSGSNGDGMYLDSSSGGSVITSCTCSYNLGNGINCGSNQLSGCTISYNQQNGISGQSNQISDCWIHHNQQNGINGPMNTISSCTISDNEQCGISGSYMVTECTVSGNHEHGIFIDGGASGAITHCTITGNNKTGLYLSSATDYQVTNCSIDHNQFGLYINKSSGSILRDCTLWYNTYSFTIDGTDVSHFIQDIDPSNIINGKPIFYLVGQDGAIIDGAMIDIGYIALIGCTNCVVKNVHIDYSSQGALVILTSSSTIMNCSFTHNLLHGMYLAGSENNQIINCTCSANQGNGLYLFYSNNNELANCTCNDNQRSGFNLSNSLSNTLSYCAAYDNDEFGIHVDLSCDYTQLLNCTSSSNTFGVYLYGSAYTVMRHTIISNNAYNFGMFPVKTEDINQDIDASNTVNGNPIYYLVGQNDLVLDGALTPIGYLVLVQCDNITMRNFNITHNIQGLILLQSNHCTMENLNCSDNYLDGMFLVLNSENNTITNCICLRNQRHGIYLWVFANNNHITDCTCSQNQGNGIELDAFFGAGCNNNIITDCVCAENHGSGIYSVESKDNMIAGCTCSKNQDSGIALTWMSWDNTVTHCVCEFNQDCGVDLQWLSTTYLDNCTCTNNRFGISTHGADTQLKDSTFSYNEIGIRPTTGESGESITNCICTYNTQYGIYGHQIRSHTISHCNISNNQGDGIYYEYYSTDNRIDTCLISHNLGTGINISDQSDTSRITDCTISDNEKGISLVQTISSTLSNNKILDNPGFSLLVDGSDISNFRHAIDESNTINGKKVYYLVDANDRTLEEDFGYLALISCRNISAQKAEVPGILLIDTTESTLSMVKSHDSANGIGIYLWNSNNNTIINCQAYDNDRYGFYLRSAPNNLLRDNSISTNTVDFTVEGDLISDFYEDIDQSNTINARPIYYLIGESNRLLDSSNNVGYLSLIACHNITAQNLDLPGLLLANTTDSSITNIHSHGSGKGIYLWDSAHNHITGCTIYGNAESGILLRHAFSNTFENCVSHDNAGDGIQLTEGSSYNQLLRCSVYNNSGLFGGINIDASSDNKVTNCVVHDNTGLIALRSSYSQRVDIANCTISNTTWYGIYFYTWMDGSDDSSIVNCTVYNISYYGIYLMMTDESLIKNCTIENNSYGIYVCFYSNNNKMYYNALLDNDQNAYDECTNQWDDGDRKGNCWSDYTGIDRNNDNIGDTPYPVPGGFNTDHYPIMPRDLPPYTPIASSPWDGATKVSTDMDLSWTGGDPNIGDTATYDVYFGTTSPPPQVTNNQSATTFDPGDMSLNTTFYWKIISWDNHGLSSTGPVWSFTTELANEPPYQPTNPSPGDGATNVSVTTLLRWTDSDPNLGDTLRYDVYVGTTSSPPKMASNHSGATYDPGRMNAGTTYYWKIVARDNHGASNESPLWTFITIHDATPPVTTIAFDGTLGGDNWYTSNVTVTLTATDDISGVNATYYRIDNAGWILYSVPFLVSSDGTYIIDFYSEDHVENVETQSSATLKIDQTPPVTTSAFDPPSPDGDHGWYVSAVTVTLSSTDEGSGTGSTWYRIDAGSWQLYTVPFTVDGDGEHTIRYFSFDKAGNIEEAQSVPVKIDTTPPTTTAGFHGLVGEDGSFVTNVTVTLGAEDETSGVNYTMYKLDAGVWVVYAEPFVVSDNGNHTVFYYSVDLAGVIEETSQATFRIAHDTEPPKTTHQFDGVMGTNDWFVENVKVTLSAVDFSGSGVNHSYYRLDGAVDWSEYTQPFFVTQEGMHMLYYYSIDMVGNEEDVNNATLKIDKTLPSITLSATPENLMRTKWLLNATVADATSGVALVEFYVDDMYVGNASAPGPYLWHYEGHGKTTLAIVYDNAGNTKMSDGICTFDLNAGGQSMSLQTVTQTDKLSVRQQLLQKR
jgi:parallel beta-helix repeat protein